MALPILRASHVSPVDPDDSGWQFLCDGGVEERIDGAQVWSSQRLQNTDAILAFINSPENHNDRADSASGIKAIDDLALVDRNMCVSRFRSQHTCDASQFPADKNRLKISEMTLQQLEKSISELPPNQLSAFREWFHAFDADSGTSSSGGCRSRPA